MKYPIEKVTRAVNEGAITWDDAVKLYRAGKVDLSSIFTNTIEVDPAQALKNWFRYKI